jgi:ATP-dependent DNA helicase RecQ
MLLSYPGVICASPAGCVRVVCATIAFGLGMDMPNIGLVIHWDVPDSLLDYVQQTGRGGRDGCDCLCIAMYDRVAAQQRQRHARKCNDEKKRDYTLSSMRQVRSVLPCCCVVMLVQCCEYIL